MGGSLSSSWETVECECGKKAVYRCSKVTNANENENDSALKPYQYSGTYDGKRTIIRYVSCEHCMEDTLVRHFTHHPNGWKQPSPSSFRNEDEYEPFKD